MTEALATPFEGKEIRTFEQNGEPWFPLVDLARAWGISRSTLPDIIARNPDLFEGCNALVGVTPSTPDSTTDLFSCVNERGLYLVMGRLTSSRLKNPEARTAILRFQRFVPVLLMAYRKREIVPIQVPSLDAELIEARKIAETCQKAPEAFEAEVLRKHGKEYLIPALQVPAPLALVHGETGWYNPSGLVELCNDPTLTPERLNWHLANYRADGRWQPFQVKDGKLWRLTPLGRQHGREYPFNLGNGHSEPRISWRESVLFASGLKREIPEDQMALPERATASGSGS
jgi:hypothetical protein